MPTWQLSCGPMQQLIRVTNHVNNGIMHSRSQANLIAKSTGLDKGSYALMKLPEHNRLLQTVPDAMHTVKDLIEKIVYLTIGRSWHIPNAFQT